MKHQDKIFKPHEIPHSNERVKQGMILPSKFMQYKQNASAVVYTKLVSLPLKKQSTHGCMSAHTERDNTQAIKEGLAVVVFLNAENPSNILGLQKFMELSSSY